MINQKDTAHMQFSVKDSGVNGTLSYRLYEKDENTGRITGVIRDGLIVADYVFQSEGMTSIREMVFKIMPGKLVQGYGEMEERNNKQVFKNKEALRFDSSIVFLKTQCR